MATVKVVFLGDSGVGKTTIISSFSRNDFISTTASTIGAAFSQRTVVVDSDPVTLKIWDTAGQERFRSLTPMYYRDAEVAVLVFAVNDTESFDGLQAWMEDLHRETTHMPSLIVVGNKTDLPRDIEPPQGEAFADQVHGSYIECSAKTKTGIDALFLLAGTQAIEKRALIRGGSDFSQEVIRLEPVKRQKGKCC
jgi:small GTP-binding protein